MDKIGVCTMAGAVGSLIVGALGGWDTAIQTLLIFMAIDFIMGLIAALVFRKSKKTTTGGLASGACWKGIAKKVCSLLLVVVGVYLDRLLNVDYVRNAIVIAFCLSELISIVEIAGLMGVLPPQVQAVLDKVIDILKIKSDKGD